MCIVRSPCTMCSTGTVIGTFEPTGERYHKNGTSAFGIVSINSHLFNWLRNRLGSHVFQINNKLKIWGCLQEFNCCFFYSLVVGIMFFNFCVVEIYLIVTSAKDEFFNAKLFLQKIIQLIKEIFGR